MAITRAPVNSLTIASPGTIDEDVSLRCDHQKGGQSLRADELNVADHFVWRELLVGLVSGFRVAPVNIFGRHDFCGLRDELHRADAESDPW
jgi:hypothetical protein